jgi:O-antigen ligase
MTRALPARWLQASAVLGATALAVLIAYGLSRHTAAVAALVLGAVAVLLIAPRWLPALSLSLFVLLPVAYLRVPYFLVYLSPASLTLIVWLARRDTAATVTRAATGHVRGLAAKLPESALYLFVLWCLVATVSSVDKRASIEWTLAFVVGVVIFAKAASDDGALARLRSTWLFLGAALAVYGVVEAELLHHNPLFAAAYASSPSNGFSQYTVWSTYRATTTLGHPLLNSTFFAATAGLAVGTYLKTGSRWPMAVGAVASAGGLVTASRSGLLALGAAVIGAGVVSLIDPTTRRRAVHALVVVGVLVAVAGATLAAGTLNRSATQEGALSSSARTSLFHEGLALARQRPVTGFGPGALFTASQQYSSNTTPGNYENSYLETAISTGVVGLVLFVLLAVGLLARSFRARDAGAFGALAGYLTSAGAFNLLQGYMPALIMFGALAAMALGADRRSEVPDPTASREMFPLPVVPRRA